MSKEIKIMKLISGESLVAEVQSHPSKIKVNKPLYFHGSGPEPVFIPFEPYTGKTSFEFHKEHVIGVWPCLEAVQKGYLDVTGDAPQIDVPDQSLVGADGRSLK